MWSDLKPRQRMAVIVFGCAWGAAVVFVLINGVL